MFLFNTIATWVIFVVHTNVSTVARLSVIIVQLITIIQDVPLFYSYLNIIIYTSNNMYVCIQYTFERKKNSFRIKQYSLNAQRCFTYQLCLLVFIILFTNIFYKFHCYLFNVVLVYRHSGSMRYLFSTSSPFFKNLRIQLL